MNRSYKDSKSVTIVYEPFRGRLSDDINLFALLREEPQLIIDLITGLARAINWLSEQGIVHAAI